MIASVSSDGRESRERVRLRASLTSHGAISGRVTRRKPPPTSITCRARPSASRRPRRLSTSSRATAGDSRSSTSWMREASTGESEAKSRASTTSMISGIQVLGIPLPSGERVRVRGRFFGGLLGCLLDRARGLPHADRVPLDDDLAEELGLPRPGLAQPHQLEQGEERHHPLGPDALGARHRGEEQRPGAAQQLDHLAHALEHRERVGLDLPRHPTLLVLDEPLHRALEEMHREVLERDVLGGRQLGGGPAVDEGLLALALGQPGAERLDPGVLTQPRSEEHTSELQSPCNLVCRLLLEKKKNIKNFFLLLKKKKKKKKK